MKQTAIPITLVLLGDIAAGKGTQARLLAKRYKLKYIGIGDFSRKMARRNSSFERIKKGILAPSDAVQKYLKSEILRLKARQGVLVDGGKMPAEARLIFNMFKKQTRRVLVIYLTISQTESLRRTLGRLKSEAREDDRPQAIRNRIKYYRQVYSRTIKFWQSKKCLKKVNGLGTVDQVNKRLSINIGSYYK